jgi:hypothetical protein
MSKILGLQQALRESSGKGPVQGPAPVKPAAGKVPSREGKEFTGAWLSADFGTSLRLVQISRRKGEKGGKVYLDDIIAEALNDLFRKYDVPTVYHE